MEDWFRGLHGARLYRQSWLPEGQIKAIVLVVHGLFEHSGRYKNLVECLVPQGYAVCSFDQRGHGRSEGLRGYVNRFTDYIDDLTSFHGVQKAEFANTPMFLLGHSVGGTIALSYFVDHQQEFAGCILSAATTVPGSSVSHSSVVMARTLSVILPKIGIAFIDASAISRDPEVVHAYVTDPFVYRGRIRARLGAELINVMERSLPSRMAAIEAPILIVHGSEDRLSNIEGASLLYRSVTSNDKSLKYYQGFYHEILNEPGRAEVLADVLAWLDRHVEVK